MNRLKKVVDNLILDFYHAFVAGRQILDVVLITNETIDSKLIGNWRGIICKLNTEKKLDIEKAYDHIDWSFVLAFIEKLGFGLKLVRLYNMFLCLGKWIIFRLLPNL